MAVSRIKEDSLVEANIAGNEANKKIKPSGKKPESDTSSTKKEGFLKSVIGELKKVTWPTFRYVTNWTLIILAFTIIFSSSLGLFDHIFSNSIQFVACTSPEGDNDNFGKCAGELGQRLIFRD